MLEYCEDGSPDPSGLIGQLQIRTALESRSHMLRCFPLSNGSGERPEAKLQALTGLSLSLGVGRISAAGYFNLIQIIENHNIREDPSGIPKMLIHGQITLGEMRQS